MGHRRTARQRALQVLYAIQCTGYDLTETVTRFLDLRDEVEPNPKPLEQFTFDLVERYLEHRDEIDTKLKAALINWEFERVLAIDRAVLCLATTELLYFEDIPPRVTINEYIEVARNFGDDDSPHFVNGILDRIARLEKFELNQSDKKVRMDDADAADD